MTGSACPGLALRRSRAAALGNGGRCFEPGRDRLHWGRAGSQPLKPVGAIASYDSGTGQLTIWENSLSFTWCDGSRRSTSGTGDDECGHEVTGEVDYGPDATQLVGRALWVIDGRLTMVTSLAVLDREMFAEAEAARLLRLAQGTLHYWLEGGERRGKTYRPVLRVDPRGARSVTWAEFVEAALLREYRRTLNVPMAELRAFIELLRESYGVPYPLADRRPYVVGRELVLQAQEAVGLDPDFCLVAVVRGQLILTPPSASFVERVTWDGDVAAGWRPHDDPNSPVLMTPDVRFGRPAIKGISTEVVWEHDQAGEDVEEIAEAFGLSVGDVRWALAYEISARAA